MTSYSPDHTWKKVVVAALDKTTPDKTTPDKK
jgi:hypothetical protein